MSSSIPGSAMHSGNGVQVKQDGGSGDDNSQPFKQEKEERKHKPLNRVPRKCTVLFRLFFCARTRSSTSAHSVCCRCMCTCLPTRSCLSCISHQSVIPQNACRKQKMRCEGADQPPCRRCRHAGLECMFEKPSREPTLTGEAGLECAFLLLDFTTRINNIACLPSS